MLFYKKKKQNIVKRNLKRVYNINGHFTSFYYTQEHIVLPRHFLVVIDLFLLEKVKLEMGI